MTAYSTSEWLTQKEVAQRLGVCVSTVYRWRREGRLREKKWGYRTVRIHITELWRFSRGE